jgi:prepilin-type N-terminal cleavage/methylation domain-containing protein
MMTRHIQAEAGARGIRGERKGFTIVELLVVIAIMGVLVALVMPSFLAAREVSVQLKCMSVMRSVVQAAHFYAADNYYFGPPTTQNGQYEWFEARTTSYTDTRGRVCPPVQGMQSYFGYDDTTPALNRRAYYGSRGCPQYRATGNTGQSSGNAYGGNHYILGIGDSKADATVRDFWVRLTDTRIKPSEHQLFFETYNANYKDISFSLDGRAASAYGWAPRHEALDGLNFVYVDGSGRFVKRIAGTWVGTSTVVPGVSW